MAYINQQKYNAIGITVDLHDKRLEDSLTGIVKSDGNGNISAAVRGVDYDVPELPSQSGQSGKYLMTDGSSLSWSVVDALPSQSGQSGKYLTTNGTLASWSEISVETMSTTDIDNAIANA